MRKAFFSLLLLALLAGDWLYTGPRRALGQLRAAAEANDPAALRPLIDEPAVQQSLLLDLLGPGKPTDGPMLVNGLSLLVLRQATTPRGLAHLLRHYQPYAFWRASSGGSYAGSSRYTLRLYRAPGGQPTRLTLARQGLRWRLVAMQLPRG